MLTSLIESARIEARVKELGAQINQDYRDMGPAGPLRLIGVLKGAFVFLADLARAIEVEVTVDFLALSSYGHATVSSGEVEMVKDLDQSIAGVDVLVVEDIVDTGLTLNYLLRQLAQRGPRSLKVVTLLDKPSRRRTAVQIDYVGFEVPDRFVVGYGLDHAQCYRHLPGLWVLEGAVEPES